MARTAGRGLSKAHLDGAGVGFQTFGARERCYGRRQPRERLRIQLLHRNDLDVIGCGQAAPQPRHAAGRQDVVGSGGIIARSFGAEGAHENAARVTDLRDQFLVMNGKVLRREVVRKFNRLVK